jgi:uncharacterized protein
MNATEALLEINVQAFCQRHGIRRFSVFGSYARGEATLSSDLDVLIEFLGPVSLLKHMVIKQELEDNLGLRVDLVTPEGLSPHLKNKIIDSQELIYEKAG